MDNSFDNDFAKFRVGTDLNKNCSLYSKEELNFYLIIWVIEGMIDLLVDGMVLSLNKHQMTFITPGKEVKTIENQGKVVILKFNRAFYCIRDNDHEVSCEGVLYFGTQGIPIIDLKRSQQIKSFERLIGTLQEEFEIIDTIQEEMLRVVLKKWLIKSTRIIKDQQTFVGASQPKAKLLREFNLFLEKNYQKLHKVSDYAELLNKSPKTISNQFKALGLKSPSKMIQERIILEAKRYLMYSDLSIKETAFQLGFEDASAFSNYFKNRMNITPGQFREIYIKQ